MDSDKEIEDNWNYFKDDLLDQYGQVDIHKLKIILYYLQQVSESASIVYNYVTNGQVSKSNTCPHTVKQIYNDILLEYQDEWVTGWENDLLRDDESMRKIIARYRKIKLDKLNDTI